MKKYLIITSILLLITGCTPRNQKQHVTKSFVDDTTMTQLDTLPENINLLKTFPPHIDILFEDFVFYYSENEDLQKARTIFPLLITTDGNDSLIHSSAWQHQRLFNETDLYTIVTEANENADIELDTTIHNVAIEFFQFQNSQKTTYHFKKEKGSWSMFKIEKQTNPVDRYPEFMLFFHKFSNDSSFQAIHIQRPLRFVTTDPDDEFNILEATIDLGQWFAFAPALSQSTFIHFNYGQRLTDKKTPKIVVLKGIGNSQNNIFHFHPYRKEWKLVQYEDYSN